MLLQHWKQLYNKVVRTANYLRKIPSTGDIPDIVSNRRLFDKTLYTSLENAWKELSRRQNDEELRSKVSEFLNGDIPSAFSTGPKAVLFRNLISPNYEARRFVSLVNGFGKLEPLFFEYADDKFTSNNELKRTLGKLYFAHSRGKKGGINLDTENVIDFVASDGKNISALTTLWGQNFVDFHHKFFEERFKYMPGTFFDGSKWLHDHGGNARDYYRSFLALFLQNGILFENMTLEQKERSFAENVFLPAFLSICEEFKMKPLIVALEPTHIEGDLFWLCYPGLDKDYVTEKLYHKKDI